MSKKNTNDLVAAGGRNAGPGARTIDDGAKEDADTPKNNKRKKSKKDAGAKPTSDGVEVAGADLDASSDTSTIDSAGDRTASKKKHKKGEKTSRESSPTPSVVANQDTKKTKKGALQIALDAMSDIGSHDGSDAQSLGSASNSASVSGHAMRSIKAVPNMRDKVAMDNYLIEAKNARSSVADDSALSVKNLMEKFTAKDAQDIR